MKSFVYLSLILAAAFLIKIPFFFAPLLGHFGSYQVTNAMMAEQMLTGNWQDFFIPRTSLVLGGQPALHLLYYPFGSFFAAAGHALTGISIDFLGRFQAAFFMFLNGLLVYRIGKHLFGPETALAAAAFFSFVPMNLILGISFQNESVAVTFLLLSFLFVLSRNPSSAVISGLFFSLALVARIHFITVLPVYLAVYFFYHRAFRYGIVFAVCSMIPLSFWYGHLWILQNQYPDSVQTSLFRQAGDGRVLRQALILSPAFYKRLAEILTGPWMTPLLPPFLLAACFLRNLWVRLMAFWVFCVLLLIVLLPQKVHDHPFYLVHALPAACILTAVFLMRFWKPAWKWGGGIFFLLFLLLSLRFYLPPALSAYREPVHVVRLGEEMNTVLSDNGLLIAQHGSSPDLLYYSRRLGWSLLIDYSSDEEVTVRFKKLLENNPDYLLISEPEKLKNLPLFSAFLSEKYGTIPHSYSPEAQLFDLRRERA